MRIAAILPAAVAGAFLLFSGPAVRASTYFQTNLTSDIPGLAANTDPNLKNPWGMSFSATSPFWVSNQGSANSTLYNGSGVPNPLVVSTPFGPTGQVFNGSATDFDLGAGMPARFIFATLTGQISGWNPNADPTTALVRYTATDGAVYTGLASGSVAASSHLYAADFANGKIDVLDNTFAKVALAGSFEDPNLPAGYSPYGIENINGTIYVQYAKVDPATGRVSKDANQGIVSAFNQDGTFIRRLVTDANLSSPWGIALAPAGFGAFGGDLLVGNFGDGTISAFDPITGDFTGVLSDANNQPIVNEGLWALKFRTAGNFNPNALYFTAGINDEANGLFGTLQAVPEPGTWALMASGALLILWRRRNAVK
ncbi:MAG: TIGR03118 family protein [Bryobacteraceae bacterium]|nr:TIGR03118 family protein [Bryobacteraceae bacterium]